MSKLPIGHLISKKCGAEKCYCERAKGHTYCEGHLWGFPKEFDNEDIKRLKEVQNE